MIATDISLWPHQKTSVLNIEKAWNSGIKAICQQLSTGGGKTRIIRAIVDIHYNTQKTIYIMAHRDTLVQQLSDEIREQGIMHGIIKSGSPYIKYRVQVCSVQTLVRRIDKINESDVMIIDECFPPGTIVSNYKKIEDLKINDSILSYNENNNKISKQKIIKIFKRKYENDLVEIILNNNKIVCTLNHPILTRDGWKQASEIKRSDYVLQNMWTRDNKPKKNLLRRMSKKSMLSYNVKNKQKICFREDERKKSYEEKRDKRESFKNIKRDGTQANNTRWKRKTNAKGTKRSIKYIKTQNKHRLCSRTCSSYKKEKMDRISNLLQNRHRISKHKIRYRNRWSKPLLSKKKSSGFEKRNTFKFIRVDNIKIQKYRSREWNKSMRGQDFVYNIEVKKTNTYLIDGFVVHNCHHVKASSYLKILKKWPNAKLLGMTATPARPDGKPLSDIFQKLFLGPQPKQLIKDGYLADFDYYAPGEVDMSGIKKSYGEFNMNGTLERVDKPVITGSAVEHYRKYADHQPAIACCVNIQHSEHVAAQFVEAGYIARAVHSKMDKHYIKDSIQGLKNGSVEVLCQCDLLGEGVDIKGAVALIMLRPTASIVIFLQQCGRVLRAMGGKRAVVLDHVNNWERHGLPDDDRDWSLDGVCKTKEESKLKRCPRCQRPVKKTYRECPYCGYLWTETAEVGIKIPEERQGELVNVKGEIREDLVLAIARKARNLKQAVKIAAQHGASSKQAWRIWTHELKNKIKSA